MHLVDDQRPDGAQPLGRIQLPVEDCIRALKSADEEVDVVVEGRPPLCSVACLDSQQPIPARVEALPAPSCLQLAEESWPRERA